MREYVREYVRVPDVITGYPLDADISIVVPQASENLIENPCFGDEWAGYVGGGLARLFLLTTEMQRRGLRASAITPQVGGFDGVTLMYPVELRTGKTYTFSLDIWAEKGQNFRLRLLESAYPVVERLIYGTGYWTRPSFTFRVREAGDHAVGLRSIDAFEKPFYTDGWQLEEGSEATTYIDGEQGEGYRWVGAAHKSKSIRALGARGGRVVKLGDGLGWTTLALNGFGMPPIDNISSAAGLRGGSIYQRSIPQKRTLQIAGQLDGLSAIAFERRRYELIRLLKVGMLRLLYRNRMGREFEIDCVYGGGAEGASNGLYQERMSLEFEMYDSNFAEIGNRAVELNHGFSLENNLIVRSPSGHWWDAVNPISGAIKSIVSSPDSTVYVSAAGTGNVWKYKNYIWTNIGEGLSNELRDLTIGPDGSLYGILFVSPYYSSAIVKWDGEEWAVQGDFLSTGAYSLYISPIPLYVGVNPVGAPLWQESPIIYVGTYNGVYYWHKNKNSWKRLGGALGEGPFQDEILPDGTYIYALEMDDAGNLYAGGKFSSLYLPDNTGNHNHNRVAMWNGKNWKSLGLGLEGTGVNHLKWWEDSLYAGGTGVNDLETYYAVARWNGAFWEGMPQNARRGPLGGVSCLGGIQGLYAGNAETTITIPLISALNKWNGSNWVSCGLIKKHTATSCVLEKSDGSLWVGFHSGLFLLEAAQITNVFNTGCATWPVVVISGPGTLFYIANETHKMSVSFVNLKLNANEEVRLDFKKQTFTSNFQGDLFSYIEQGNSKLRLESGENNIALLIADSGASTSARLEWKVRHWTAS